MNNTNVFFALMKKYQDDRNEIISSYETRVKQLEPTRGSVYFTDEMKKAEDEKDAALKQLKGEFWDYISKPLYEMRITNKNRGMTPPTEEELRLVQLLKMKENTNEAELRAAANTLKHNATCLSILAEIARKNNIYVNFITFADSKELPVDAAETYINSLTEATKDFIEYDTTRASRVARKYHENIYGVDINAPALPKRRIFETKEECFEEFIGLSGDAYTAFIEAVD